MSAALIPSPPASTIRRETVNGLTYLTLSVIKTPRATRGNPVVEVSPDLVDWYCGSRHTTVIHESALRLVVRDGTPIRPGSKRFIRIKSLRTGQ